MASSPGGTAATPTSASLTFNSSRLATVPAGTLTLFKAQAGAVLSVTDATDAISGASSGFAVNSAGITLSTGYTAPTTCSLTGT